MKLRVFLNKNKLFFKITSTGGLRIQINALLAMQEAAEAFLVNMFEDLNLFAIHGNRQTIQVKDICRCRRIRNFY